MASKVAKVPVKTLMKGATLQLEITGLARYTLRFRFAILMFKILCPLGVGVKIELNTGREET